MKPDRPQAHPGIAGSDPRRRPPRGIHSATRQLDHRPSPAGRPVDEM